MTAFVTGTFVFSYDVGSKISGSLFCDVFKVDNNNLDRYWMVLAAKCLCIPFTMLFVNIIPSNNDVHKLSEKMNAEKKKLKEQNTEETFETEIEEESLLKMHKR